MNDFSSPNYRFAALVLFIIGISLTSCAETSNKPAGFGVGPNPTLPEPKHRLIPTVEVAPAIGWSGELTPTTVKGMQINAFAKNLDHPRWLYVLPNGDVLVAETNAPYKPDDNAGFKGWVVGFIMDIAGATPPSANRITLLRDSNGDGVADVQSVFLTDLNSPFGMTLVGDNLFIANSDAILRFPYQTGDMQITKPAIKLIDLPAGKINHHWTKNIIANDEGTKLYVTVGSNSNVAENGIEAETDRAAIWEVDIETGTHHIFA